MNDMTLRAFLELLSNCSGDEALAIVSSFQSGALTVEGISAEDFDLFPS